MNGTHHSSERCKKRRERVDSSGVLPFDLTNTVRSTRCHPFVAIAARTASCCLAACPPTHSMPSCHLFCAVPVDLYTLYSFHFLLTPLHLHFFSLPSPVLASCPLCLPSSQVGSTICCHITPKPCFTLPLKKNRNLKRNSAIFQPKPCFANFPNEA